TKQDQKTDVEAWLGEKQDEITIRDSIAPAHIHEDIDYLQLGKNFSKTICVVDFPGVRRGNWLTELYRFKDNLSISTHLEPASPTAMIKSLNRSIMDLDVRLKGKRSLTPEREIETEQQLDSSRELLRKLQSGGTSKVFQVHMYLHLQADSLEKLERMERQLEGILSRKGLKGYTPKNQMLPAFKSMLPTTDNTLPEWTYRTMDAEAASSLFPYDESEIFHSTGVIKGENMTTGSLVVVDQYSLDSHNEFAIGQTGKGKTFYMLKDMIRYYQQGIKILAIDPERQFARAFKRLGGQVISLSVMSKTLINPLEIRHYQDRGDIDTEGDDFENETQLLYQKIQRLKIFFKLIKKDISPHENSLIERYLL
ncbi:VirB4 family type IV secretion system protein, partial [Cryptosporangium minutisporangium]